MRHMPARNLIAAVILMLAGALLFARQQPKPAGKNALPPPVVMTSEQDHQRTMELLHISPGSAAAPTSAAFPVTISVDPAQARGEMKPIYRFFGADEPNYAYMPDGLKLLGDIGKLGTAQTYFRAHNMLCTGDGTPALKWGSTNAYTEDAQGRPVYDWTITDRIFDAYLAKGVKPYAQIGFMPRSLSTQPDPYQHSWAPGAAYNQIYTGWAYPPKDYDRWRELATQWVRHCVEKYGRQEVEQWYWQVWNEANIGYWRGTPEEFRKLHDYAIDGVRRALPTARVGGADSAGSGGQWTRDFLEHCLRGVNYATGKIGTPLDFISFHAKGSPSTVDNRVRMGIANQLRTIDEGFRLVAAFPELKSKPIVIGESDPDGCAACQGPQLAYRNTTMYSSYTAATFGRKQELADRHGVNLEGALTWAFEFEDQPIFAGFRVMATRGGINLPVFNVFRMLAKMSGRRVAAESSGAVALDAILKEGVRGAPDVSALATSDKNRICVLAWHYHDDDVAGPEAAVTLALKPPAARSSLRLEHFRIDAAHSNAYEAWKRMGAPAQPSPGQTAQLEKAGQLERLGAPEKVAVRRGTATVQFTLPRQAVSLLVFSW